jgi:hypothetical protein
LDGNAVRNRGNANAHIHTFIFAVRTFETTQKRLTARSPLTSFGVSPPPPLLLHKMLMLLMIDDDADADVMTDELQIL